MVGQGMALTSRHDHSSMDMGGDADAMSMGTINVYHFPKLYWSFVGAVIAVFAICNAYEYLLYKQRMRAARNLQRYPSMPKSWLALVAATLTAVVREIKYTSLPSRSVSKSIILKSPAVGPLGLILAYVALILTLLFYNLDLSDRWMYETIAYRCGVVSIAQLPLIVLLAGKNNLIGLFTGLSYEKLNWIHRWVARCLLLSTTIHFGYWLTDWAPYNGYITHQVMTDHKTQRGLGAWCVLVWIVFSSFAPIRKWSYEVFVIQHILSFIALFVMIYYHLPASDHKWVWIGLGIFMFDRVSRWTISLYNNFSLFHRARKGQSTTQGSWAFHAQFTPMAGHMTKVTIPSPSLSWKPGQHAYVSCHSLVPFQSHPFTISSIPEDDKIEFFVRAHKGATRRFFQHAEKLLGLPTSNVSSSHPSKIVAIEGPYGRTRPLQQFDSVCFIAGGTGLTYTAPLFRDLVRQWQSSTPIVTKYIRFVWVFKSLQHISWLGEQLSQAMALVKDLKARGLDIEAEMSFYITCDDRLTADSGEHTLKESSVNRQATGNLDLAIERPSEKDAKQSQTINITEIDPRLETTSIDKVETCEPDGACCCKTVIEDEEQAQGITCTCSAACGSSDKESNDMISSDSDANSVKNPSGHKAHRVNDSSAVPVQLRRSITLLSGRPNIHQIVRNVLEQAEGETAVLACGPQGLNEDARRSVASLSDERAVHKGTGAQGVWFWGESFGW